MAGGRGGRWGTAESSRRWQRTAGDGWEVWGTVGEGSSLRCVGQVPEKTGRDNRMPSVFIFDSHLSGNSRKWLDGMTNCHPSWSLLRTEGLPRCDHWAEPARANIYLSLCFVILSSLNILSQILQQAGRKGTGLKGGGWWEQMVKEGGDGYPSWYLEKRMCTNFNTRKVFPYQNLLKHPIGGLNVSGGFSIVKCRTIISRTPQLTRLVIQMTDIS